MWVRIPVPGILWEKKHLCKKIRYGRYGRWLLVDTVVVGSGGTTTPRLGSGTREATCRRNSAVMASLTRK